MKHGDPIPYDDARWSPLNVPKQPETQSDTLSPDLVPSRQSRDLVTDSGESVQQLNEKNERDHLDALARNLWGALQAVERLRRAKGMKPNHYRS